MWLQYAADLIVPDLDGGFNATVSPIVTSCDILECFEVGVGGADSGGILGQNNIHVDRRGFHGVLVIAHAFFKVWFKSVTLFCQRVVGGRDKLEQAERTGAG